MSSKIPKNYFTESETAQILRDKFTDVIRINVSVEENNLPTVIDRIKEFYFSNKTIDDATVNEISNVSTHRIMTNNNCTPRRDLKAKVKFQERKKQL